MKRILKDLLSVFALFALVITAAACSAPAVTSTSVTEMSPAQALALMERNQGNPDFRVLDVRTPSEYAEGHLSGAFNIDIGANDFRDRVTNLKRDDVYLVYCRTGNRSRQAISIMEELKFEEIYHLSDGITAWVTAGLPMER